MKTRSNHERQADHAVLLVDDDAHVRNALARSLRGEPYAVHLAASADEALRHLETRRVDVIVTDEKMPGVSGFELLERVRRSHPDVTQMMLTGFGSLEVAARAMKQAAVYRFFTKPCDSGDLKHTIRQALAHQELRRLVRRLLTRLRPGGDSPGTDLETLLLELRRELGDIPA